MDYTQPKFSVGQSVRYNVEGEITEKIVGMSWNQDRGWLYQITSREADLAAKTIVEGIKTCSEDELLEVASE